MRIGIEAQRIFREKKHGMDFVALELIKNLPANSAHEFFVFVNASDAEIKREEFPGVIIINHKAAYPVWEQVWLPKMAEKLELDVLHCTANTFPISCKVPTVLTLHDIIFLEKHPLLEKDFTLYQRFGNLYRRFLVKNFIQRIDSIATVSQFEEQNIAKALPSTKNLEVVYNGVGGHFNDSKLCDDEKASLRSKYGLPENYLLFLGNTDPKKNTRNTLKAFASFLENNPDAFLVVGDLKADYINDCLAGKGFEKARSRVVPVGYIANTDLPGLIKMSRAFVYTSLRESFGIPLLEGMACGVPVLTSDTSSMPEIAAGAAFLIDPASVDSIAHGMSALWEDGIENVLSKIQGLRRSAAFSWSKMASEYVQLYQKVAS